MIGVGIGLGIGEFRGRAPGIAPKLDLNFASTKSLTASKGPTPSFSRASTGTYFNSSGVLTTAAINAPRFNHTFNGTSWVSRGLLVEAQRTNLVTYSEDLTNAGWTKANATINANAVSAPDGLTTADEIVETTATGNHGSFSPVSTVGSGATFTASGFIKKKNKRYALFYVTDNATQNISVLIDMDNGTIVGNGSGFGADAAPTSSSITNVGNGWYRISITRTNSVGQASARVGAYLTDDSGSLSTGFSYAGSTSNGIYAWGFQIETATFQTSYIPSTGAALTTRSADVCQITGTDFSGFWNGAEGTIAVEFDRIYNQTSGEKNAVWFAQNSASPSSITMGQQLYNGSEYFLSQADVAFSATPPAAGITGKSATGYKVNDYAFSLNGASALTDTVCTVPTTVDRLVLGNQGGYSVYLNGHIARLRYFNKRLPNATLQKLST